MSLLRATRPTLLGSKGDRREDIGVTVCIAAICEGNIVVGASDRMITAGDIQFEPAAQKAFGMTSSIAVMFAGDAALQVEVGQAVQAQVNAHIEAFPTVWLTVHDVAQMFVAHRNSVKQRRAEAAVLQPLGLTSETFLQGAHGFGPDLAKTIATDLVQFPLPAVAWIVCGIDHAGAHIYTIHDGALTCQDQVGFAAIGWGARHAESQFMLAAHARHHSLAETLLLTYSAKKRAEVAPGVGYGTDMFTAGPGLGTLSIVHETVQNKVDVEYVRIREGEATALNLAKIGMETYVGELRQAQQSAQVADGNTLSDDEGDELTDNEFAAADEAEPDGEAGT